ncbi:transcriptional regulator [Mycobacterium sp. IS-1742]|uniref:TetR/AcrR family transcriptional regulator n=1 Tax=Mycobacterium sp. IS-1742 TaxID=1772285 RepID=UPI000740372A|nr:TetR/AcrR family transcriptional regulator [Mycobacterium sp. IS-1742]KUI30364.1 transcriptional regulator [Mycobacterium sp. IS-1742]
MVRDDWVVGGDRRDAAAERIYAAAVDLVVSDGLDAFDIDTLARRLHCSRATVYRYAGGKAQIRDAVLTRLAAGVIDTVRHAVADRSGADRVVTAIVVALEEIRSDPMRKLLMSAASAPGLAELHSSPVLHHLAADLTGITDDDPVAAQWIVRVVMSLAYWPSHNPREEREMLRRFVTPAFGDPPERSGA